MKTLNIALLCLVCGISAAQLPLKKIRSISAITSVGDKAFFAGGTDFDSGEELWVSDGTPEGTVMVKDINPGYVPSAPSQMISFKGKLFFSAYTAQFGQELWTSDGTAAGTAMVKDLSTNDGGSDPRYLTVFKDHLYFRTSQGGFYKSDGTAAGTILLEQNAYYIVNGIKDGGNYLYYTTNNPNEFKRTDGTIVNTITVPEPEDENVNFHSFHVAGGQLFVFMASQSQHIVELYVYDENTTSWKLLKAVHAPMYGDHEIDNFTAVGTRLFFSLRADYGYDNYTDQLWVSDGTVSGTLQLKSSRWSNGWSYSTMDHFIAYKDALYFRSGISETNALWKSDGTPTGTVKIHDVQIMRPINSSLNPPVISNDLLWFCGASGYASDAELWYSDGTTEGTKLYADLNPKESATPNLLSNANDKVVYFAVGYSYIGTTLWSTSPAPELNVLSSYSASIPSGESLYLNNPQGTSCIKISVVLHNSGHRELALSDVVVTGSEFYLKGELPEFLKPGEKLTIDVYFKPFSSGKKTGELIIHSNDQDEPRYLIKLVGEMSAANVRQICTEFDNDMVKTLNALSPAKTITLSKTVVEEKLPALTPVGLLSLPGFTGPVTYTFVNGNGDTNNKHFVIQGNQLLAGKVFDYETKPIYTVRIKATTAASSTEETFVISIIDKPASLVAADCQPVAQSMNYNLTDTEFNSAGHLFAITNNGRILRSSNEGVNWEFLTTGNWGRLTRIFFKGNTGYITGDYVMLKSDDNGATWFQLYLPFIGPATASFLDASRGYVMGNGYVLYTANGGKSWDIRLQSVSYDGLHHPWFFDENVGFAFEGSTSLKKTINGGLDWEYVTVTTPQWDRWIDMWFLNDKDGFLTNINKTYRTKDGGKTWTVVPDVAGELLRIEFSDQKNGYVFGGNYGSLLYVTTDGGNSWEWKMNYLANGRMTGIARSAAGKLISVHQSYSNSLGRSINFSVDNGNTSAALDDLPDEDFAAIDFITEDVGFLRSQTAQFKTVDKGMTWKRFSWSRPIYYWHFFDENNALLSDGFIIYKTSDGGATMEEVLVTTATDNPYVPAGKLYAVTDDVIFAYSDYGLYRSLDAGEHWQLMSQYGYGSVRDMQFLSATVGYRMSLFGSIEKTTDGGTTWELIYESHPLSSDAFHSVSFVDQNIGYKGGEKFSKTVDGGITWTTMYTNFSSDIFDVHFTDALHGYAAVRHRNLYETFDGGLTWNDILNSSEYEGLYGIQYKHGNIYMIGPEGYLAQIKHPRMKPVQAGYAVGPQVVCVGDTHPYLLSENYSGIYQWNVSGAAVNDEGSRAYIHFPHAGEYTFTINNSNGCGISEPRLQTVIAIELPAPILTGTELIESLTPVTYQVSNWDDELHYFWTVTGAKSFTNEDVPNSTVTWKLGSTEDTHVQVFAADPKSGCSNSGSLDVTIELALGIEDEGNDVITVYPNPTPAEVTIKSRVNEPLLITLYNTTGIEYFTDELARSVEAKIQLQHLPAGLYYLEITNSKGNKITKKILKQ